MLQVIQKGRRRGVLRRRTLPCPFCGEPHRWPPASPASSWWPAKTRIAPPIAVCARTLDQAWTRWNIRRRRLTDLLAIRGLGYLSPKAPG